MLLHFRGTFVETAVNSRFNRNDDAHGGMLMLGLLFIKNVGKFIYIIIKTMRALSLVHQLWFIVPVNLRNKSRVFSINILKQ